MTSSTAKNSYQLLDPKEEEELFKTRLLNVEEKPFKRITKRLTSLYTLAAGRARQEPTPPPEGAEGGGGGGETDAAAQDAATSSELEQLREDITLDFAAFDATIVRLQFLFAANERERARYAGDRVAILDKCRGVRENTAALRAQLERARATLEQRRRFDDLADRITSNRLLRPRADQQANLRKLEEECGQLERESEAYAATWRERREQFSRIMDESMRLRRLIRDEKEEVERREGMNDDDAGGGGSGDGPDGESSGQTPRPGIASGHATPRPDSGNIPKPAALAGLALGGRTPARDSPGPDGDGGLKPPHDISGSFSRSGSHAPASREPTPRAEAEGSTQREEGEQDEDDEGPEEGEDVEMEGTQPAGTPRITVEGEDERMDTT